MSTDACAMFGCRFTTKISRLPTLAIGVNSTDAGHLMYQIYYNIWRSEKAKVPEEAYPEFGG